LAIVKLRNAWDAVVLTFTSRSCFSALGQDLVEKGFAYDHMLQTLSKIKLISIHEPQSCSREILSILRPNTSTNCGKTDNGLVVAVTAGKVILGSNEGTEWPKPCIAVKYIVVHGCWLCWELSAKYLEGHDTRRAPKFTPARIGRRCGVTCHTCDEGLSWAIHVHKVGLKQGTILVLRQKGVR
jgi:hypothetical protein